MDRIDRFTLEHNIILPAGFKAYLEELGKPYEYIEQFLKEYCALTDLERSEFIYQAVGKKIYRWQPVDIHTFIHDHYYVGQIYDTIIYPFWEEVLDEIYPAPLCKRYNEALISSATRAGKSTASILSALYEIYLLTCMVDPTKTFQMKGNATIVFALLSKDNSTACSQLGADIYKGLAMSPYFNTEGGIRSKLSFSSLDGNGTAINERILLKAGSSVNTLTGTDLYFGILDEANMPSPKIPAEKLVETRINMYRTMLDRKKESYRYAPAMSGMIWLISSPMDTGDVIGTRIDEIHEKNIPFVFIRDNIARWEAKPMEYKDTFEFFLGSDSQDPCIIEETDIDRSLMDPERILNIPRTQEFYNYFQGSSVRTAIQEVAGRRTVSDASLFTSVNAFQDVFIRDNHIFRADDLNINVDNMNTFADYMIDKDYFKHPDKPECYRYIHLDIASKRDRFGLASVYSDRIKYFSADNEEISQRKYYIDFCLGISSAGKSAVDILKVLEWIYSLKKQGYPIKLVTTDSHQGELARQIIAKHGIKTEYLSVEKTTEPYYNLKNLILSRTLVGFKNPLLINELRGLRIYKRGVTGEKVEKGKGFTDDLSDSLAGATWSCSQDKYYKKASESIEKVMELADTLNNISIAQGKKQPQFNPEEPLKNQIIQTYNTEDMNFYIQGNPFMSPWQNRGKGKNRIGNGY